MWLPMPTLSIRGGRTTDSSKINAAIRSSKSHWDKISENKLTWHLTFQSRCYFWSVPADINTNRSQYLRLRNVTLPVCFISSTQHPRILTNYNQSAVIVTKCLWKDNSCTAKFTSMSLTATTLNFRKDSPHALPLSWVFEHTSNAIKITLVAKKFLVGWCKSLYKFFQ